MNSGIVSTTCLYSIRPCRVRHCMKQKTAAPTANTTRVKTSIPWPPSKPFWKPLLIS